jgi:hypothetical protein
MVLARRLSIYNNTPPYRPLVPKGQRKQSTILLIILSPFKRLGLARPIIFKYIKNSSYNSY